MMKKLMYGLLLSALVLTLVGGCQPAETEEVPPQPVEETAPPGKESGVTIGGTLNLYGIDPHTLDPAISGDSTSHQYVLQLFSGLVILDDNMEPAPDIAEDWQISNGGKTYTFTLRQDVRFHDGRKVTAEDFKYSWQRAADPATGSLTAAAYLGDIAGIDQVLSGASREISGVRVIDDYTLEVTIDAPKNYFLSKLTYPTAYVVDRDNVESGRLWWHKPNGTGPFKLGEWVERERLVLERNDFYYGEKAYLDSVAFALYAGRPMSLYETGETDVTGVSVFNIDRATDPAGLFHDQFQTAPELSFFYIGFNFTKPPFNELNIRQAFTMALDKDKLASLVFRDTIQVAGGILPPGMPGFNENLSELEYDPARALELIRESSYGRVSALPPITITTMGRGGIVSGDLEAIVFQWQENLGVEVQVRQIEPERFFYNLKAEKDDMYEIGWIADYPHPQDFLEILFRTGEDNNGGEYSNPEVDALLERASLETDYEKSLELYQQAEQLLINDAATLPLWFGRNQILVKSYVKGYELNPLGLVALNKVWIEK
ncbi:MAG: peptide ABC transporter substrate-binding protein [Dehalococcoidales bacterium]